MPSGLASRPSAGAPNSSTSELRPRRPDRRVLGLPAEQGLRRAAEWTAREDRTLRPVLVGILRDADEPRAQLETSSLPGLAFDGPHRHRWL